MARTRSKIQSHKRRKLPPFARNLFEFVHIVLTSSSAHGLSHIVARRHYLEILLWILAVLSGVMGAVWLSLSTWSRYQRSPTVISLEKNYLEWNTTFPSITICTMDKVDLDEAESVAKDVFPLMEPKEGARKLKALGKTTYDNFDNVDDLSGLNPDKYLEVYKKILFNFSYSLSNSNAEPASFTLVITENGPCYNYNSLTAIYNNPEYWAKNNWDVRPLELLHGNPLDGDMFAQVMDMNSPLTVFLHGSTDLPDVTSRVYLSDTNRYLTLDVTALSIYSTDQTRSLTVRQRKCRFQDESNLETSPVYSYNLCRTECRMRLALSFCGCVPYFYRSTGKYKICGVQGMKCLSNYKENLIKLKDDKGDGAKCDCYPPCNDVNYAVLSATSVDWFLGSHFKYGLIKYPTSRLKRDIVFGVYDLLVQFGGSVGLCLGCSILSIAEFGYFFTLRLFLFLWNKYASMRAPI